MRRMLMLALVAAIAPAAIAEDLPYCKDPRFAAARPCFAMLANGGINKDQINVVTIYNVSTMDNATAADLALTADRSTQDGSPNRAPYAKGLMKNGDHVCVTDRYLAWFDYSTGDGVGFGPPYGPWDRPGVLAGLWALDRESQNFKHLQPSPDGSGDRWARNQLIPGSASPGGEQLWWDAFGPPLEHALVPVGPSRLALFAYHYARSTPRSEYTAAEPFRDAQGVHYASQAYMTSWHQAIDVVDDEDVLDVKNAIRAVVEYICRPDDIVVVWRIMPTNADVLLRNKFVALWLGYANDEDDTSCDVGKAGQQWPRQFYGRALYTRSSGVMFDNWTHTPYQPGAVGTLRIQPTCNRRFDGTYPDYHNDALFYPTKGAASGAWLQVSESATMTGPALQITVLDPPAIRQDGSEANPVPFDWNEMVLANENYDGTIVAGPQSTGVPTLLKAKTWYQSVLSLRPLP